jgi:hypothetical protein
MSVEKPQGVCEPCRISGIKKQALRRTRTPGKAGSSGPGNRSSAQPAAAETTTGVPAASASFVTSPHSSRRLASTMQRDSAYAAASSAGARKGRRQTQGPGGHDGPRALEPLGGNGGQERRAFHPVSDDQQRRRVRTQAARQQAVGVHERGQVLLGLMRPAQSM